MSHDLPEGSTYRPIGEVAALLRLQPHVLRFWETKFQQIAPLKRSGGRRYYRREDVRLLFRIRDLLYVEGYTLRGAQKVLRANPATKGETEGSDKRRDEQRKEEQAPLAALATENLNHATRADLERVAQRLEETLALYNAEEARSGEQ